MNRGRRDLSAHPDGIRCLNAPESGYVHVVDHKRTYSDGAVRRRRELGFAGEAATARSYRRLGYEVLDRNWRCADGELDLVLFKDGLVVFCEVKTRSSTAFGVPAAAVTMAKQRRIRHLAMRWIDEHEPRRRGIRFDVASVIGETVDILEGAF